MKIDRMKVKLGKTFNLGNYESERIDIELEAELHETDPDTAYKILREQCERYIHGYSAKE